MTDDEEPIGRVAQDYVKAIWSADEWGEGAVSAKRLAQRFGVTPATVSATLRRLDALGLIRHLPYGTIELTDAGARHALAMVRRHRLLETFLVEMLRYDWTEVHQEAEELEHVVSERMIDRIADLLGDPTHDPHGDPIPDRSGGILRPRAVERLDRAAPGRWTVTRVADHDPARLAVLADHGLVPGRTLVVQAGSSLGVRIAVEHESPRLLSAADAEAVLVTPASRD